jgi:hypothetical protein
MMAKEIDTRDYMAEFKAAGGNVKSYATGLRSDPETIQTFIMGRGRRPASKPTQPSVAPSDPNTNK